jgi:hypothetical protein
VLKKVSILSKPAKPLRLESKHESNNNKQQDISHSKLVPSACVLVCPSFLGRLTLLLPFNVWSCSDLECVYRSLSVQDVFTCLCHPQSCIVHCWYKLYPFACVTHSHVFQIVCVSSLSSQPRRNHVIVIILGNCKCVFLLLFKRMSNCSTHVAY